MATGESMGVQHDDVGAAPATAPLAVPQCELLFELFMGNMGAVQLGRVLKGPDAGRLVVLRKLGQQPTAELASAIDLARSIVHPSLAKVLGKIRCGNAWFVATEYISGVTLFELGQTVTNHRSPLDAAVAARIVLDAVKATDAAQRLLAHTANLHGVRCIYPESVWIADFGEVFLSELLMAPLLAQATGDAGTSGAVDSGAPAAPADVHAAIVELLRLVCEEPMTGDQALPNLTELPSELRDILLDEGGRNGIKGYETLRQFIDALSALGEGLLATERQVSRELQLVMGLVIERRRQKLEMLDRCSLQAKEDDATRVFRVAVTAAQNDTEPPPEEADRVAAAVENHSSQKPERRRSEPAEEGTKVFGSIAPRSAATNALALDTDGAGPALELPTNPVSAVWRQAQALFDAPARRTAQRALPASPKLAQQQAITEAAAAAPKSARSTGAAAAARLTRISMAVLILIIALLVATAIRWLWLPRARPATPSPSPTASASSQMLR